jgi:hypothetical protein
MKIEKLARSRSPVRRSSAGRAERHASDSGARLGTSTWLPALGAIYGRRMTTAEDLVPAVRFAVGHPDAPEAVEDAPAEPLADPADQLADHLMRWGRRTGIGVEIWALPRRPVPAPVRAAVLAAVGEALRNVERHSRARFVSIAVTVADSGVRLTVSDNGDGFAGPAEGPGITRMRAAFAAVGGTLRVRAVQRAGTTVSGRIPRAGGGSPR